jgi:hypothetical protein
MAAPPPPSKTPNWSVIITGGMLAVIIIGQWFATWSGPTQEKFQALEKNMAALSANTYKDIGVTEASVARRFGGVEKDIGEIRLWLRDQQTDTEKRRIEVATRNDLQTTRLEFLAEIRRLDEKASGHMPISTFNAWRAERDILITQIIKRIEQLEINQSTLRELLIKK